MFAVFCSWIFGLILSIITEIYLQEKKMNIGAVLKFFHIAAAFMLVSGAIGHAFALQRARQATDVHTAAEMLQLSVFFNQKLTSPGGLATILLGLFTAWQGGWPILGFLQGAQVNWVLAAFVLNLSVYPVIFLVLQPRGMAIGKAAGQAMAKGEITTELKSAMHDKAMQAGLWYNYTAIVLIVLLMVLKPF
jgi:uncharacterized membrane protein